MIKRILCVLLVLCLLPICALADDWNEEYLAELNKLNEYLRTYGTGEIVLIYEIGNNMPQAYRPGDLLEKTYKQIQNNGRIGQYAAEFEVYANALLLLETGDYEAALLEAEDLNTSASYENFRVYIEDGSELSSNDLNAFGTTEELYNYIMARKLEAEGDGYGAVEYYDKCRQFVDAQDRKLSLQESLPEMMATPEQTVEPTAEPQTVEVGEYITFGTYPQTVDGTDDTPIEWLVLDVEGDKALLLSKYGLDSQPYNEELVDITWENCTLRTWLNKTFIGEAFTLAEQYAILLTDVDNSQSQCYSGWNTDGGNDTQDRVFLLSYAEANEYLGVTYEDSDNMTSRISLTDYASKTADFWCDGWWWLRSPGRNQLRAADVYTDGSLTHRSVSDGRGCVRPALWVNLESLIYCS